MVSVKKNLVANLFGKIWVILASAIFTPLYIQLMGVESYGIVGIYTTLTMVFSLLDFGLQTTVSRELPRLSSDPDLFKKSARDLIRTLEWVYWPMAVVIGLIVFLIAPYISEEWIQSYSLSHETVKNAIYCIGLALAFQFPSSLYHGSLMGLQRHVILNSVFITISTLKCVGLILVLKYISSTIHAFLLWQMALNALQTMIMAYVVWRILPQHVESPRFDRSILKRIKGFAFGITGTSTLAILLVQIDKILLSRMLSLEMFGYYALASMLAATLSYVSGGVLTTYYPQFSKQVAMQERREEKESTLPDLSQLYHQACQILSVIIMPLSLIAALFSWDLLFLWTQNKEIADHTYQIMSLLMLASLFNGLAVLPYTMQLAHGWTRLSIIQNVVGLGVMIPLMFITASRFGGVGAAFSVALVGLTMITISIVSMHKKILACERKKWLIQDVCFPMVASLSVIVSARYLIPMQSMGVLAQLGCLALIFLLAFSAGSCAAPLVRHAINARWKRLIAPQLS